MKLLVNAPINALSFGNVSVNILRELYKKNIDLIFFPIGEKVELSAYDKIDQDFIKYLQERTNNRFEKIDKNIPSLKLWHIFGSESRYTKNQSLFTFHEVSEVTPIEKNLLNLQDNILVSSNYTKSIFELNGLSNVTYVPLGFDTDFHLTDRSYLPEKIHFGLMGKFENRKNSSRIIKTWMKLFGNKSEYQLTCAITNQFLEKSRFQNDLLKLLLLISYTQGSLYPRSQGHIQHVIYQVDNH